MAEQYSVTAVLSARDKNLKSTMDAAANAIEGVNAAANQSEKSISKFSAGFSIVQRVVQSAMTAVKNSLDSAISRYDTLTQFPRVMQSLGFSAESAQGSVKKLSDGIEGLPTTLDAIVGNTQMLTASLGDLDKATDVGIAVNDMFLAGGQGAEAASRAFTQFNQILAKGKVDMQSWNTIMEVAPGQLKQLAGELLGASANQRDLYEALQSGKVSMDQMLEAMVRLDTEGGASFASFSEQARAASDGIATSLANIGNAVAKGLAGTLAAIDAGLADAGMPKISAGLDDIKKKINAFFEGFNRVVRKFTAAIAPHLGKIKIALEGVVAGLVAYKAAKGVEKIVNKIADSHAKASESLEEYTTLIQKYGSGQGKIMSQEERRIAINNLLAKAEEDVANKAMYQERAAMLANKQFSLQEIILGALQGEISLTQAAQEGLNLAMEANPIGLVIAAITTLITVTRMLHDWLEKLNPEWAENNKRLEDSTQAARDAYKELGKLNDEYGKSKTELHQTLTNTRDLAQEIVNLNSQEELSAEQKARLKTMTEELGAEISDLSDIYDEETGRLKVGNEYIAKRIELYAKEARYQTVKDAIAEAEKKNAEATLEAAQAEQALMNIVDDPKVGDYLAQLGMGNQKIIDYIKLTHEAEDAQEEYNTNIGVLYSQREQLAQDLAKAQVEAARQEKEALITSLTSGQVAIEQLSEANQKAVSDMQSQFQALYDAATSMSDEIVTHAEKSAQDYINVLAHNRDAVNEWASNMEGLRSRFADLGLDTAILDQLQDMGVESAPMLNEFINASDDQLRQLAGTYTEAGDAAKNGYIGTLQAAGVEIPMAIQKLVTQTQAGITEGVRGIDWTDTGNAIATGTASGIESGIPVTKEAAMDMGKSIFKAFSNYIQMGSPARTFIPAGISIAEGIALGVNQGALKAAEAVNKIATAIKQAMSLSATTMVMQTQQMNRTMTSGMLTLQNTVRAAMNNLKSTVESGVKKMAAAITAGTSIMYQSGVYLMQGLANGINAGAAGAISTAEAVANRIVATTRKAMQIGSPSKLAYQFGVWWDEGLANGMDQHAVIVADAAQRISNAAAVFSMPSLSSSYGASSGVSSGTTSDSRPIEVITNLNIDGKTFATVVAPAMAVALGELETFNMYRKGVRA